MNTALCERARARVQQSVLACRQSVLVKTRIIVIELLAVSLKGMFLISD